MARDAAIHQIRIARSDSRKLAEIFGLPVDTPATAMADHFERWAEQDRKNREELDRLNRIVRGIEVGEIRSAAEHHLQLAQAAFEDGRLEEADGALAELEFLRRSAQTEMRHLWVEAVLARSALADQRLDGNAARALVRDALLTERQVSRRVQWQYVMREAQSYQLEDPLRSDNSALESAIALYRDEALPLLDRTLDPFDWADTQYNLGNALSTLGDRESGPARLEEAVLAYEAALSEWTREGAPVDWAATQNNLAIALAALARREIGTERLEAMLRAIDASLLDYSRERDPIRWAMIQNNLGNALAHLGRREGETERLELAVLTYESALSELTREQMPLEWAMTQVNLAGALADLGEREDSTERYEAALEAIEAALLELTRERSQIDWAATQNNLGSLLRTLGRRKNKPEMLEAAVRAHEAALLVMTRERFPLDWAMTQASRGLALKALGERENGTERLEEAVLAFEAALLEYDSEQMPLRWAWLQVELSSTLGQSGERNADMSRFIARRQPLSAALHILIEGGLSDNANDARQLLALIELFDRGNPGDS
jgi:tetratricopeptide (TPR) repeat protein